MGAAAVAAVAAAAVYDAFAGGLSPLSGTALVTVATIALAELAVRTSAAWQRDRTPVSRLLISAPKAAGQRGAAITGLLVIVVCGAVMGLMSLPAETASHACASSHCDHVVGSGWLALMVTLLLASGTAVAGIVFARKPAQLVRAVMLGTVGPLLGFTAFAIAVGQVTGG